MSSYKEPTFQDRTALANKAKRVALEQLRAKQPVDEATLTERREAAKAREAAQIQASKDKIAARNLEKAQKRDRAADIAAAEAAVSQKSDEERKTDRDAKYAARKNRKGKK